MQETGVIEMPVDEKVWQVTVRLPRDLEPMVRALAQQRVVPPAIMLRQLIKERLDQIAAETRQHGRENGPEGRAE